MPELHGPAGVLAWAFIAAQIFYSLTFLIDLYLFSLPAKRVDVRQADGLTGGDLPFIVLFYPVLQELEETMRTTMVALGRLDYPADRFSVVAVPNSDDLQTLTSLHRLRREFPFLQIMETPPTSDPRWRRVWQAWEANPNAYWWHQGERAGVSDLPPKKTRQLIYAFYATAEFMRGQEPDFLVNYIDADSCPPRDHFRAAAAGMMQYDVLQAQNVAGNLNDSLAASWHAFDHMAWDGKKYPHLSAPGHPYWMLGKGLFFRASDLEALGGFHPWITIEDPEVGMRFFAHGKRLGIIENPLIEEVPLTFGRGITQRKRWVCGFFQSLGEPARRLGFTAGQRLRAWTNFLPCLSLWINAVGVPTGLWALWAWASGQERLPAWTTALAAINLTAFAVSMAMLYASTWKRTALVLERRRDRLAYMLRINPLFVMVWWLVWLIPLAMGLWMYLRNGGLVWERTEKVNANRALIENLQPEAVVARAAQQPQR